MPPLPGEGIYFSPEFGDRIVAAVEYVEGVKLGTPPQQPVAQPPRPVEVIVRVTGSPTGDWYPGVFTKKKLNSTGWVDGMTCQVAGLNDEALEDEKRYKGVVIGRAVNGKIRVIVGVGGWAEIKVGTCTAGIAAGPGTTGTVAGQTGVINPFDAAVPAHATRLCIIGKDSLTEDWYVIRGAVGSTASRTATVTIPGPNITGGCGVDGTFAFTHDVYTLTLTMGGEGFTLTGVTS